MSFSSRTCSVAQYVRKVCSRAARWHHRQPSREDSGGVAFEKVRSQQSPGNTPLEGAWIVWSASARSDDNNAALGVNVLDQQVPVTTPPVLQLRVRGICLDIQMDGSGTHLRGAPGGSLSQKFLFLGDDVGLYHVLQTHESPTIWTVAAVVCRMLQAHRQTCQSCTQTQDWCHGREDGNEAYQ